LSFALIDSFSPTDLFTSQLGISIMNFKSVALIGLSLATVGLALPARADETANVVENTQTAITTGDYNSTNINNSTKIRNSASGRRSNNAVGNSVKNDQLSDTQGYGNSTNLNNSTEIRNSRRTR
jgi:hypothetical protein